MRVGQIVSGRLVLPWLAAEQLRAEEEYRRAADRFVSIGNDFLKKLADSGISELARMPTIEALDQGQRAQSGPHSDPAPETILAIAEDKPKILEALKDSFAQLRIRILKLSDADGDKPQTLPDRETTVRGALMIIDRRLGQRLGQATTYALLSGVVPPWRQERHRQKHE